MKNTFKFLLLVLILSALSCKENTNNRATEEHTDDYSAKIDSLIQTTAPRKFNGVVLITKNGETRYSKAYGYSNFENKTPLTTKDNFRIMSNSKQITAVLILKEAQKGKIDLKNPIREYLPDLKQTWADTVTVHQLLNMSSGIVGLDKPLLFKPGKGYRYSNPGYGLLGRIIEKVTGKEYVEMANNLFKELEMHHTYCYEMDKTNQALINGYWISNGEVTRVNFDSIGFTKQGWKDFIPTGGVISNVYDLHIWDTKLHQGAILDPEYYQQMVTPSNEGPHAAFDGDTLGYAYGLRIHDKHPVKHLGHGGRGFGFASIKFYIPEKNVDVIVWENIYSRDGNINEGKMVYHFENEIRKIVLSSNLAK